jgi:hypothetical protein
MRMTSYPADYLYNTLSGYGFMDVEISIFLGKIIDGVYPFVFINK